MPPGERRDRNGAGDRRHRRDMNKPATPEVGAPTGRWRALAVRCLNPGGAILSSRLSNALFVLFVAGILAYGAGFAWYMLARFDLVNLIRDVNSDDSFYYFEIARNLAEGKFSTFDGGITRTNGYHPIWLFLIAPFYWVFDKEAALFAIKAFEIMLVAGGVALVAAAARLARLPWYLMFAALPMLYQQRSLLMGMEAAAALFMLGLFILTACLFARSPARWKWPLAAVAFALPWVRLEYIAISLAATAALCLIEWSRREPPSPPPVPLLGAVAGILAYFAYNGIVFGGVTPVSGATKQMWSQGQWEREGGYSFVRNFRDVLQIPAFDYELLVALEVCVYVVLVWWFARRSHGRTDRLLAAFLACVFGLAAGHLAKFAQTVLTMHPNWGSDDWYFVPAYLLKALVIPVRCYVAIHFIRRFLDLKSPRTANLLSTGIVVVGTAFLFTKADFTGPFQWVDRLGESTRRVWGVTSHMGVQVMNRVLPEDSVVGSRDAGIIGYFSRYPVVNLDGLANSYGYLRAQKEGTEATFYQRYGITHYANVWIFNLKEGTEVRILPAVRDYLVRERLEQPSVGEILFESPPYLHNAPNKLHKRQFRLLTLEPPEMSSGGIDRSDWFWQRMEPHFDHRSDGVGLIVDGRMAQAFVRDCAPDELVQWSWTGAADELAAKAWTQTETGMCVNARVLPRDALPPVRVETVPVADYIASLIGDAPPLIRSDWNVHIAENSLVYVKERCGPQDVDALFFLHLEPIYRNDLPGDRKQYGFDNLDFAFGNHDVIEGGVCIAIRELPDYAIAALRTGQLAGDGHIWKGSFDVADLAGGIDRSFWQRMEPHFDHRSDGIGLIVDGRMAQAFVRDCTESKLLRWLTGQGDETVVDVLETTRTGLCVAVRVLPRDALPPVKVETVTVGDWVSGLPGGGPPVIRSDWDVYLVGNSLIYAKDHCSPEDAEPHFFLHLYAVDVDDLPNQRKQYGFDNLDFDFAHTAIFDGKCLAAEVPLPDYAISEIRTGQYVPVDGGYNRLWEGKIRLDE